jgi:hypothetical protein
VRSSCGELVCPSRLLRKHTVAAYDFKAPPFLGHPFPGSVFGIFSENGTKIHGI